MTDDLDRRLRQDFAPPDGSSGRVARSALNRSSSARWRGPLAAAAVAAMLFAFLLSSRKPAAEEGATLTLRNHGGVIEVVDASGHVSLLSGGAGEASTGGVILYLGENR